MVGRNRCRTNKNNKNNQITTESIKYCGSKVIEDRGGRREGCQHFLSPLNYLGVLMGQVTVPLVVFVTQPVDESVVVGFTAVFAILTSPSIPFPIMVGALLIAVPTDVP